MDWLLAGLGNPGQEYARTRHNAGFWLLQHWADSHGLKWQMEKSWKAQTARFRIDGLDVGLCLPQDYMNRSGGPVRAMAAFHKIPPARVLAVHDDLDLPPGTARLKWSGGHGGHNGLRDLDRSLGTRDYWRLRIGIGHPGHRDQVTGYVLSPPSPEEAGQIGLAMERSLAVLPEFLAGHPEAAQKILHTLES